MSRSQPSQSHPQGARPFDESVTSVRVSDRSDGETFTCEEEPHMLSPENGYGYYPLKLGQFIHGGKLEIVRKLGWASNSSVWLARAHENVFPARFVAVKILSVNTSAGVFDGHVLETDMLQRVLNGSSSNYPGWMYCLRYYGAFVDRSIHGPHVCIATEVLGGSLVDLRNTLALRNGSFPVSLVKRIIKQKLLALDFLHRGCGIVHTDVKPDNVLVSVPNVDATIEQTLKSEPSATYPPRHEPSLSPDPIITVKSQPLKFTDKNIDLRTLEIRLTDFGETQVINRRKPDVVQPVQLRAPEVTLEFPWSTAIDIWSVGCLAFEYLSGASLFQLYESNLVSLEDVHLRRMMEITGNTFSLNFINQCKNRANYFNARGELLRCDKYEARPLEGGLRQFKTMKEEDVVPAATFVRKCLIFDPRERPTAQTLLLDSWLAGA